MWGICMHANFQTSSSTDMGGGGGDGQTDFGRHAIFL